MNTWLKKTGSLRPVPYGTGLRIAIALFIFLALFILIVEKPGSSSTAKKTESRPLFFPRLNIQQVTHAEIDLPSENKIELRRSPGPDGSGRSGEAWMKGEEKADPEKAEAFLEAIYLLRKEALVSRNSEKQSIYNVDPKSAIHITLWSNSRERANFYVGQPENARAQYVRLEESHEVWESSPPLPPFNFELSQ